MTFAVHLEDLASVKEAKTYGLSEAFIRKCFVDGRLRRYHLGSRVYFSRQQLAGLVVVSEGPRTKNDAEAA